MTRLLCTLLLLASALASLPTSALAQGTPTQRFALVVGANKGGSDRVTLRYAIKDAQSFGAVLEELGGVQQKQLLFLKEPSPYTLDVALDDIAAKLPRPEQARSELIFYYSGHSDEVGLLLGGEHFSYERLRARLAALPVDVRVVILDSCASGNLTRAKGGRRMPAFLSDASTHVKGHAFLTSSAEDEAAQESDRLGGSFFTHYLISGMRGAADTTGDRRVTLNEAYQFAFQETLSRTEHTLGGAQHAAYDINLSGHGDLVLTEYSKGVAVLTIDADVSGHLYIRGERGQLIAELEKQPGRTVELGLPAADYQIQLRAQERAQRANLVLKRGQNARLTASMFSDAGIERTTMRGDQHAALASERASPKTSIPIGVDLLPWIGTSSIWPDAQRRFSFNILGGVSGGITGFELAGLLNITSGAMRGVQLAGLTNVVDARAQGIQLAGVANLTRAGVRAAQLAPLNLAMGDVVGAQVGAFNLTAHTLRGLQLGAINVQALRQPGVGLQLGAVNHSGYMRGLQLGAINHAFNASGAQLGAINILHRNPGGILQLGAINIATRPVTGFSLGVINISPASSASLGIINVHWEQPWQPTAWASSEGGVQAGVRHGGDHTYNIYHVGAQALARDNQQARSALYTFGATWGLRRAWSERLGGQADLGMHWLFATPRDIGDSNVLYKARLGASRKVLDWATLYGGPSFNLQLLQNPNGPRLDPMGSREIATRSQDIALLMWPGLYLGVDLL